jgi:hypothetical protein
MLFVHAKVQLNCISQPYMYISAQDIRCTGEDALGPYSPHSSAASDVNGFSPSPPPAAPPPPPPNVFLDLLDLLLDDDEESSLLWLGLLFLGFLTDDEREGLCFPREVSPPPPPPTACWLPLRERGR